MSSLPVVLIPDAVAAAAQQKHTLSLLLILVTQCTVKRHILTAGGVVAGPARAAAQ